MLRMMESDKKLISYFLIDYVANNELVMLKLNFRTKKIVNFFSLSIFISM